MPQKQDRVFGGLIPSDLKRMTRQESGSVTLQFQTYEHDLSLLRSIADAVRVDDEFAGLLEKYADLMNRLDEAERNNVWREIRALREEATDLASEIDAALEWSNLGDNLNPHLTEQVASELETALRETAAEPTVLTSVGGAA